MSKPISEVRPLNEMILVEPIEAPTTAGGLMFPDAVKKRKPKYGIVRKVNTGAKAEIREGETVVYPQGLGTEILLSEGDKTKEFELIRDKDLWLVFP